MINVNKGKDCINQTNRKNNKNCMISDPSSSSVMSGIGSRFFAAFARLPAQLLAGNRMGRKKHRKRRVPMCLDVCVDVLRFMRRRELAGMELVCWRLHAIVSRRLASSPFLVIPRVQTTYRYRLKPLERRLVCLRKKSNAFKFLFSFYFFRDWSKTESGVGNTLCSNRSRNTWPRSSSLIRNLVII